MCLFRQTIIYASARERETMTKYVIMAEVDQKWLDTLDHITRNQEGFIWIEVKEAQDE